VVAIAAAAIYIIGQSGTPAAARHPAAGRASPGHRQRPQQAIPAQFAGSWSGTVHQTNPALDVTVQLTLPPGTSHGTIGYPQLHCTGRLGLLSEGPGLVTLSLTITSGQSSCVNGKVRLAAQKDGSLAFTFLQPSGDDPTGKLARPS
jgi:hypothetical protein